MQIYKGYDVDRVLEGKHHYGHRLNNPVQCMVQLRIQNVWFVHRGGVYAIFLSTHMHKVQEREARAIHGHLVISICIYLLQLYV